MRNTMRTEFTAVVKKSGDWWIGWIEEVPGVNCQEHTHEELLESLKDALKEALELNRHEARAAADGDFTEIKIAV
jgi:predicted RNase H-like HicB family nuclease